MKIGMRISGLSLLSALSISLMPSCEMPVAGSEDNGKGELRVSFEDSGSLDSRSMSGIPDTDDFLLTISDSKGNVIYDGTYGASPESMMVEEGSYVVNVRSCDFVKPAFSMPQFGDEQCVIVPSGGVADVKLVCRQLNSGMRLVVDGSFLTGCPDGVLFLKSSKGSLMYGYAEKRIAYFPPGSVSLMLSEGGNDKVLMTRTLQAQEVLTVNVSVALESSPALSESISVSVDTSRVWRHEDFVIGGSDGGKDSSDALTVNQAMASAGETDVWVCGYVVGGDLTSSSASFDAPFSSKTNILLGSRSTVSSRESCLSVQLSAGSVRDALNLVENPSLLGRKICVRGDIVEAYYGLTGIKNITDYELK